MPKRKGLPRIQCHLQFGLAVPIDPPNVGILALEELKPTIKRLQLKRGQSLSIKLVSALLRKTAAHTTTELLSTSSASVESTRNQ